MKSLTGTQKHLIKFGSHAKNLIDMIGSKVKSSLMSDKLVVKNHAMSIGFDAPENPATTLKIEGNIVGKKFA